MEGDPTRLGYDSIHFQQFEEHRTCHVSCFHDRENPETATGEETRLTEKLL
jgi:hypothetical protein